MYLAAEHYFFVGDKVVIPSSVRFWISSDYVLCPEQ